MPPAYHCAFTPTSLASTLVLSTLFNLGVCQAAPLAQEPAPDAIVELQKLFEASQRQNLPKSKQGYLQAQLAASWRARGNYYNAEKAYERALTLFSDDPPSAANYATTLDNFGTLDLTYDVIDPAEALLKKALMLRERLGNPMDIARTQQHLAELSIAEYQFKRAEQYAALASAAVADQPQARADDRLSPYITLAYARCARHRCEQGMHDAQQAMMLARTLFAEDSVPTGHAYMALGFTQWSSGATQAGEESMLEGLRILRHALRPEHPALLRALRAYRDSLRSAHRFQEADVVSAQISNVQIDPSTQPCANCTISVHALQNRTP
ncbi:MAG: hypothetical protein JWM43_1356 [Acidobacteriaceae bacterium]|nr:hypothetical protein [Acidobacteriaceae bacterium]